MFARIEDALDRAMGWVEDTHDRLEDRVPGWLIETMALAANVVIIMAWVILIACHPHPTGKQQK